MLAWEDFLIIEVENVKLRVLKFGGTSMQTKVSRRQVMKHIKDALKLLLQTTHPNATEKYTSQIKEYRNQLDIRKDWVE